MINIAGQKFGRLVVIAFSHLDKWRSACWKCRCGCGRELTLRRADLVHKTHPITTCGCAIYGVGYVSHEEAKDQSPEYISWRSMHGRCSQPTRHNFHRYGGRGIGVCERWKHYANFLDDMGRKPSPEMTIDRINPDANYEPSNCRWATPKEQAINRAA